MILCPAPAEGDPPAGTWQAAEQQELRRGVSGDDPTARPQPSVRIRSASFSNHPRSMVGRARVAGRSWYPEATPISSVHDAAENRRWLPSAGRRVPRAAAFSNAMPSLLPSPANRARRPGLGLDQSVV